MSDRSGQDYDNMGKTKNDYTPPDLNLGPEYNEDWDLKRYEKLSNAISVLRDVKDSGLQNCAFFSAEIF